MARLWANFDQFIKIYIGFYLVIILKESNKIESEFFVNITKYFIIFQHKSTWQIKQKNKIMSFWDKQYSYCNYSESSTTNDIS